MDSTWTTIAQFDEKSIATVGRRDCELETEYINTFLNDVSVEKLFQALGEASQQNLPDKVQMVCDCLERIFSSGKGFDILIRPEVKPFILQGIIHSEENTRKMTLKQLKLHFGSESIAERFQHLHNGEFYQAISQCLMDSELTVARLATDWIVNFVTHVDDKDARHQLLSKILENQTKLSSDSVNELRYLELVSRISALSNELFKECEAIGLVQPIVNGLDGDDPLFVMNLIDFVPFLGKSDTGLSFLFESGVVQKLMTICRDPLCGGSALRILGELNAQASLTGNKVWSAVADNVSSSFLQLLADGLQSSDTNMVLASMDGIAAFASGSSAQLKLVLDDQKLCQEWLEFGSASQTEYKATCLSGVASILASHTVLSKRKPTVAAADDDIWALNAELFERVAKYSGQHKTTIDLIMYTLRQPFEEMRLSCFALLQSVAAQGSPWGIDCLFNFAGFLEFLLNRTTEGNKKMREWKFAVVDALMNSPYLNRIDELRRSQLTEHFNDGPYLNRSAMNEPELQSM